MRVGVNQFPADASVEGASARGASVGAEILRLPAANGGAGAAVAILRRREPACRIATQERESSGAGGERSEGIRREAEDAK